MLKGKTVVLGLTGSIACYKIANLASMLIKLGADVQVIMTENATNFINPITFETLTRNKCLVDMFDRNFQFDVKHISLSQKADIMLIAPASANIIAKMAHGIADDMLSTTILACDKPIIVSPAMNTHMYENKIVQDNIKTLKKYGMTVIEPDTGMLACRDIGKGKMPSEKVLLEYILKEIAFKKDLTGKNVLVTAGATREIIDPVRYITNHSSGKMGYAIANACVRRGANVTLISGKTALEKPMFVNFIEVVSAKDMFEAVKENFLNQDIIIKSAAVADYRPKNISDEKIKKSSDNMNIELERTDDILAYLGEYKTEKQFICGFSMETENMLENSRKKLVKKKVDMIACNNLKEAGAGFETDTNILTIITDKMEKKLDIMSKDEVAHKLLDVILENINN